MPEMVREFYDGLAGQYHLIFEDWEASIARQAAALGPLLESRCGPAGSVRILDCACGIGTQALGLAKLGFRVTGTDLSPRAIERARVEAAERGLELSLHVADMRQLDRIPETGFDAVVCMDNALPHFLRDEHLSEAVAQMRAKLRAGGLFVAGIRDYDRLIEERTAVQGPGFYSDAGRRRIVFQLWDWIDERRYVFHLYITQESAAGWRTHHGASTYRALLRNELTGILEGAGFSGAQWMLPADSGFYQPLILATAADKDQDPLDPIDRRNAKRPL